jgi:DDE family transposase
LGQTQAAGAVAILRRLLAYAEKLVGLTHFLQSLTDPRPRPRIATEVVASAVLYMFLSRVGSLNALEQTRASRFWRRLHQPLPSADSLGRIAALIGPEAVREQLGLMYSQLKANKALPPTAFGLMALALDGHESLASYLRHCEGCSTRTVHTLDGPRLQYYHRQVTAVLLGREFPLLLDVEPQQPGEDEIATALRLLERVLERFPRAFDVVVGDGLYTDPRLYNYLIERGKDVLTVLKANHPSLLEDAKALFASQPPTLRLSEPQQDLWDQSGFTTWPSVSRPVRVVQSVETQTVHRQATGQDEQEPSTWVWVTTLSPARASSQAVATLGHSRWRIENQAFHQLVHAWHFDHVYRHQASAILIFELLGLLAFNLFQAFYYRNLKPVRRQSYLHIARQMQSELYGELSPPQAQPP